MEHYIVSADNQKKQNWEELMTPSFLQILQSMQQAKINYRLIITQSMIHFRA
jgi:hypothetical protein